MADAEQAQDLGDGNAQDESGDSRTVATSNLSPGGWVLVALSFVLAVAGIVGVLRARTPADPDAHASGSSWLNAAEDNAWLRIARPAVGSDDASLAGFEVDGARVFQRLSNGALLRPDSEGVWSSIPLPKELVAKGVTAIQPRGRRIWAAGSAGVFATDSQGATWERIDLVNEPVQALRFTADGSLGWAFGTKTLFEYRAGSWSETSLPAGQLNITQELTAGDASGHAWIALQHQIARIDNMVGEHVSTYGFDTVGGPRGPEISAFTVDASGREWIGTVEGKLSHRDAEASGWTDVTIPGATEIKRVRFARYGAAGWVIDSSGKLFVTRDRGLTWRPSPPIPGAREIREIEPIGDGTELWAQTDGRTTWRSVDSGKSYVRKLVGSERFSRPSVTESGQDIVVGTSTGTLLRSVDGGATWTSRIIGYQMFTWVTRDGQHWRVGGPEGTFVSEDGGATFSLAKSSPILDAEFAGKDALIIDADSTYLRSRDSGRSWTPVEGAPRHPQTAVVLSPDGKHAVRLDGVGIGQSADGGRTWTECPTNEDIGFTDAAFGPDWVAWLVAEDGSVYKSETCLTRVWSVAVPLRAVATAAKRVWIAGVGVIARSLDGGAQFETVEFPVKYGTIDHLAVLSEDRLLAFGKGFILQSADAGAHFRLIERRSWPPMWPIFSGVASIALLFGARRFLLASENRTDPLGIVGKFVTDRPIDRASADKLGFCRIALGLSWFLRNKNTEPPLTVAVDAPWGRGKSSLLALLANDLRENGFGPIQFNAWHHEHNSNVLASLFQCVVDGSVPRGILRSARFRFRLLYRRLKSRDALVLLALAAIVIAAATFAWSDLALTKDLLLSWKQSAEHVTHPEEFVSAHWPFAAGVLVFAGFVRQLFKVLSGFGFDAAKVLTAIAGNSSASTLRKRVVFRERFARDFADVSYALSPARIVLIIDDLDRCSPACVGQVLEAVDFLTASGSCAVVLGMWGKVVRRALDVRLRRLYGQSKKSTSRSAGEAARFLEKLVHVEIGVPRPSMEQAAALVGAADAEGLGLPARPERKRTSPVFVWLADGIPWLRRFAIGVGIAMPIVIALVVGVTLPAWVRATDMPMNSNFADEMGPPVQGPEAPTPAPAAPPASTAEDPKPSEEGLAATAPKVRTHEPALGSSWSTTSTASEVDMATWLLSIVNILGALGVVAGVITLASPGITTADSGSFKAALRTNLPIICHTFSTPRSLKRFLNRIRFYAGIRDAILDGRETRAERWQLAWDAASSESSLLRRIWRFVAGESVSAAFVRSGRLPSDAELVGLAALHALDPVAFAKGNLYDAGLPEQLVDEIARVLKSTSDEGLAAFQEILALTATDAQ